MGIYLVFIYTGNGFGTIISGFITQSEIFRFQRLQITANHVQVSAGDGTPGSVL